MEKRNKVYLVIIIVVVLIVVALCGLAIYKHKSDGEVISDAVRFKEEYESLNESVNESNDKKYLKVSIAEDNPVIYKNDEEIIDVLKNESAIVYFGFSKCPWCRNIIEPLLDAAKEKNISKIYYVDIFDIRDSYRFNNSIIPEQTKKGTEGYYKILDFLGDNLEEYYISDEARNMYDTGVTRLYAPSVVAVSDGEVKSIHIGTLDSQKDPYVGLSKKEKSKLKNKFKDLMDTLNENEVCDMDGAC